MTPIMEKKKKILFALPSSMAAELDRIASEKQYTRSELIRQALREYYRGVKKETMEMALT